MLHWFGNVGKPIRSRDVNETETRSEDNSRISQGEVEVSMKKDIEAKERYLDPEPGCFSLSTTESHMCMKV